MLSSHLFKRSFQALCHLFLWMSAFVYADSSSLQSASSLSAQDNKQEKALAFHGRNDDKSLYNRNYYKYDWDYRENWRADRDDYLKGGDQPPVYRRDGSYAPPEGYDYQDYGGDGGNETALAYTASTTAYYSPSTAAYTNYTYVPTGTGISYPYYSTYSTAGNQAYPSSYTQGYTYVPTRPSYTYIPAGTGYYATTPSTTPYYSGSPYYPYSAGTGYPTYSGDFRENYYQMNRYYNNPNSSFEYGGNIRYNIGTNDVEKPANELYETNYPYNPNPVYYTNYPNYNAGYYSPGYSGSYSTYPYYRR
ncbi:hypothetical protein [Candidatus Protochlamydia phocaeensis]|uniref:hypothetical protein n=1 Tax=Candidatus Protochlamydia phocaeensis TaxID=1414722 RepID=UPI000838B495|nr:hypothetical protein [Candidatus Protochlamydia phocaeensis]